MPLQHVQLSKAVEAFASIAAAGLQPSVHSFTNLINA
jgi:hypothetical protein